MGRRVEMRRERENHEKEVFLTRYDHIKPNKDNMNVSINMASEKKKSKQSLAKNTTPDFLVFQEDVERFQEIHWYVIRIQFGK